MMLTTLTLLAVLATGLTNPIENGNVQKPSQDSSQEEIQSLPQSDQPLNLPEASQLPQSQIPQLEDQQSIESKPDEDLKTEPSHWNGYGGYHGHGRDYNHGFGHGYGGHGYGQGYRYGHGYGGYGGYGHGYGNGLGFGFGYPGNRRSSQYYPGYDYYRPGAYPYYYPQNYYIGGSIFW